MENTNNTNHPADNGPRPTVNPTVNIVPFEPRKWKLTNDNKASNRAERAVVTDMAGGMTEVLMLGDWDHHGFTTSPYFTLKKHTDYVFTFWLNGGENDRNNESCQLRIHYNSIWDDKNPYVFKLNRNYIKETKHVAGWYRFDIPFNTGSGDDNDSLDDILVMQFQFTTMNVYAAFMPHRPEFDDLNDEPLPDPRIPQRHNIVFAGGYPRDSRSAGWTHLVYGDKATHAKQEPNGNAPSSGTRLSLINLANAGVDIESILSHMESCDIVELLRGEGIEELKNAGVDIESIFAHLESDEILELLRGN